MQRRIFWASAAVPWNWKQCKRAARQALERLICHGEFGVSIPLEQVGRFQPVMEEPILKRRDRDLTFEVRADILKGTQPPDVGKAVYADLQPLIAQLPAGYRVTIGGPVEESAKANKALAVLFPVMIMLTLVVIMFRALLRPDVHGVRHRTAGLDRGGSCAPSVRSALRFQCHPGADRHRRHPDAQHPDLHRPDRAGAGPRPPLHEAIIEATVRRARPVLLTALAAALAFIPLTFSVFWSSLAFVLIGGIQVGTVLTLLYLPALCALVLRANRGANASNEPEWEKLSVQQAPLDTHQGV